MVIKKAGTTEVAPAEVARTGIEPATQGFSVLKIHFRLLLWITLNQPILLRTYRENQIISRKT